MTVAGKTLLVEAIELLVGGRADPVLVRPGAEEAVVEGRFVDGDGNETSDATSAAQLPALLDHTDRRITSFFARCVWGRLISCR